MTSQAELHRTIERLVEENRLDEAMALVKTLPTITAEEMDRILDDAPLDDEPLGPGDLHALAAGRLLREALVDERRDGRRAGWNTRSLGRRLPLSN